MKLELIIALTITSGCASVYWAVNGDYKLAAYIGLSSAGMVMCDAICNYIDNHMDKNRRMQQIKERENSTI